MADNVRDQEPLEDRIREAFAHEQPTVDMAAILDRAIPHAKASAWTASKTDPPVASSGSLKTITVVMAAYHRVFAEGLGVMLDGEDDIEILGMGPPQRVLELVTQHQPTILLLDAYMPEIELGALLRQAKAKAPRVKLVVLSADTRRQTVDLAIQMGADAVLAKDISAWHLAAVMRKLLEGPDASVAPALRQRSTRDPDVDLRIRTLSAREREILGMLANGYSNPWIAEECFLSLNTVRMHIQNVLVKLGVHSKLEAVAFALEHQVVPLGDHPARSSQVGDQPS
jgi:DNA-binding NarL/FixJ family response regulator